MTYPAGETVQLIHRVPGTADSYGDATLVDQAAVVIPGVGWDPGTSTESVQGQDQVVHLPRFLLPPGTAVDPMDAIVRPNGKRYEVTGEPGDYVSVFTGWAPGVVVNVQRVTG